MPQPAPPPPSPSPPERPRRQGLSLRARLWLLVAALAVPLLGLGGEAIWSGYRTDRARAGTVLVDETRALAQALDDELATTGAVLGTLSHAHTLAAGDLPAFSELLRAAAGARPAGVRLALYTPDATLLAASADAPPLPAAAAAAIRQASASGQVEIAPIRPVPGAAPGEWGIAMALPARPTGPGGPAYVLAATIGSQHLSALLHPPGEPPEAGGTVLAALLAPDGTPLARPDGYAAAPPDLPAALRHGAFGLIDSPATPGDEPGVRAFARAPQSGFFITLDVPQADFEGPLRASLARLAGAGALALLAGLAAAYAVAHSIVRSVGRVARVAAEGGSTGLPELDGLAHALAREEARSKQAQAELESTNAELSDVLGSIGDAFYAIDAEWHVVFANRRTLELFHREESDLLGRPLLTALPELQDSANVVRYREVMSDGRTRAFRTRSPVMGRWADYTVYPRRGGGVAIYFRDVSAQVAAEQALRGSEARLRLAQRIGGVGSFEWVPGTGEIAISEEFAALHGLPPGRAVLSRAEILDLVHHDDRDSLDATLQTMLHAGPGLDLAYRIVRAADGATRWLIGRGEVFRTESGTVGRVVGVIQDVTEWREAQRRQDEALAVLNSLLDNAPVGLAFFDRSHRAARLNGAAAQLAGRPVEALLGRPPGEMFGDAEGRLERMVETVFRTGEPVSGIALNAHVDGQPRHWMAGFYPVPDPDGGVLWVGAVVADVSDQRRAQEQLRRLNETLEARVKSEVAAREDAQGRLAHSERIQALGQLAGGMAHDFNNVLQAVSGCAGLIERRADQPETVLRLARRIMDAAERGGSTTRRLLAFARRDELRAERIEPADLLAGIHEMIAPVLGSAMKLELRCAEGLPSVMADRGQLETVLVNLSVNARDAMPGGGDLVVSAALEDTAPGTPHPASLPPGRYVRISVRDNGEGMDAATLARATEPFFTTKAKGKGTGLGLAMARGFAEQSGGGLAIASAPGAGTTVTLWLPAGAAEPVAAAPLAPATASARRILVVDDDELVRETVAAQLRDAGYTVRTAPGAEAALLVLAGDEAPDLLLSDFSMPAMNGLALIRAARDLRPDLPAILLTGYAGEAEGLAADLPEHFALLRKPAEQGELIARIEGLLAAI